MEYEIPDTPGGKLYREWREATGLRPNHTVSADLIRRIDELVESLKQKPEPEKP